jgi:hypothetical protein
LFILTVALKQNRPKKERISRKANLQTQNKRKEQINQTAPRKQNKWNKDKGMERRKTPNRQIRLLQFDLSLYFCSYFGFLMLFCSACFLV